MSPRTERLCLCALVVAAVALYVPSLSADFTLDDNQTVVLHPGVRSPFSVREIFLRDFWGNPWWAPNAIGTWRPFVTLTYWLDWHLGGGSPEVFHAANLAWFAALLFVTHRFLRAWAADALPAGARLFVVAAFGAMAIHADVVPSVTGRAEILAMIFSLLALECAVAPAIHRARFVAIAALLVLALSSKESSFPLAVALPLFALAGDLRGRRVAALKVGALSLAVTAMVLVYRMPRYPPGRWWPELRFSNPLLGEPFSARVPPAFDALATYVEHAAAGFGLLPSYGYATIVPARGVDAQVVVGAVLVAAFTGILIASRRSQPRAAEAVIGFGGAYAVVSHVLQASHQFVADRNFFFPSFWLLALLALTLEHALRPRAHLRTLCAVVVGVYILGQATLATLMGRVWHDRATLATFGVAAAPNAMLFRILEAEAAVRAGRPETAAWSLLIAEAIRRRFPEPIAPEMFPSEWDDLPASPRLVALKAAVGGAASFASLCDDTRARAHSRGFVEAEAVLASWCSASGTSSAITPAPPSPSSPAP